ncbi:MAG: hypothetical protein QOE38_825 [Thermoleophilaceae bacterium]|nr:hypothetical protein [Thermoleophilaceae bacterium]
MVILLTARPRTAWTRLLGAAIGCGLLLGAASPARAEGPQFAPSIDTPVSFGAGLTSLAAGDIDGDGHVDLAIGLASGQDSSVAVLLGDGHGGFRSGPVPPIAGVEGTVLLRDVNGDGKADLLLAERFGQFLHVLLGAGDGTFAADDSPTYFGAVGGEAMATADFNRDGHLDVSVAASSSQAVTVMLGDGTGRFTLAPGAPSAVSGRPDAIAAGDFNEDGAPDVATSNYASSGTVSVLLGAGDGTLRDAPGSPLQVGSYPASLSVADIDRDRHQDLVFWSDYYVFRLLRGDGTGASADPQPLFTSSGGRPRALLVADFDGRRGPDLAVTEQGAVIVQMNDGKSAFTDAVGSPFLASTTDLSTIADVNGDGFPDIVGATPSGVSVLLDNPPAPPQPPPDPGDGGGDPPQAATVAVPSVKGMTLAAAKHRLAKRHLRLGRVRGPQHTDRHHVLRVIRQTPRSGTKVARDTKVKLRLRSYAKL